MKSSVQIGMSTNHHEGMTCSDGGENCFPTYYILMDSLVMYVNLEHKINMLYVSGELVKC